LPTVRFGSTFEDLTDIGIRLTINGEVRQDGNSAMMLNPIVPMIQHMAALLAAGG
jgi:2-keto-4-pentenoate hydratase/2-oxohepta-3-ene-1,7-dioic acid hydratase in catechol pathway